MRRFIVGAVALATCIAVPASAFAGTSPKATGDIGSPGNATYQLNGVAVPFTLVFTAQGSSDSVKGNFTFTRSDGGTFTVGNVNCLNVNGTTAGMSGVITSSSGPNVPSVGDSGYIAVVENGQGSKASGPSYVQVDAGSQYTNNCPATTPNEYQVTSGTVQVTPGS